MNTGWQLSRRQRQILVLIGEGLTAAEIADRLGIGERTVESHRAALRKKLGISGGPNQLLQAVLRQLSEEYPVNNPQGLGLIADTTASGHR